jgi:hypothetical protein
VVGEDALDAHCDERAVRLVGVAEEGVGAQSALAGRCTEGRGDVAPQRLDVAAAEGMQPVERG